MFLKLKILYMKKFKKFIKKCILKKYKGTTYFNKDFQKQYFIERKKAEKKIKKLKIKKELKKDRTYLNLKKIYLSSDNKFINEHILTYYKKFEVNFSLKSHYDKNFKKKTNSETNINSYIFLGLLINKLKVLNKYQKINCILKIIDKLLFSGSFERISMKNNFLKLLKLEKKILKSIL